MKKEATINFTFEFRARVFISEREDQLVAANIVRNRTPFILFFFFTKFFVAKSTKRAEGDVNIIDIKYIDGKSILR